MRHISLPKIGYLLCLAQLTTVTAQEWTRFRGPNGSGISRATTVPVRFAEKNINWKVRLAGVGHSSPVLWGERIFVTSGEESTGARIVQCLRTRDGRQLWSRALGGERHGKHADN